jgi:hypothetical protein
MVRHLTSNLYGDRQETCFARVAVVTTVKRRTQQEVKHNEHTWQLHFKDKACPISVVSDRQSVAWHLYAQSMYVCVT